MRKTSSRLPLLLSVLIIAGVAAAQTPAKDAGVKFTATSENVSGAGETIKINLSAWSTDAERDQFVGVWNLTVTPGGAGGRGGRGGGGGGGGAAGRGGAAGGAAGRGGAAAAPVVDPADVNDGAPDLPAPAPAVAAPAAAGRGGGGQRGGAAGGGGGQRGGGGGGGGGRGGAAAAEVTPASALATALQTGTVLGYVWTSETIGYAVRYAYRLPLPDGGERIILATDRRLGSSNTLWKPSGSVTPANYEFSLIELRVNAKGEGEGKVSLAGNVAVDAAAKTIALEGYGALPVLLKAVKPVK